jgi:hypothetical protein
MPSVKTVDDIKSSILRPSITSHFLVEFALPSGGATGADAFTQKLNSAGMTFGTSQETLNLLCSEAVLPGSSIATMEINNDHTGVTERHAHRRFFDDRIDFTFYVDVENYLPIIFFETWIDFITGAGTTGDFVSADRNTLGSKNYYYRMNYADDYTADRGLKVYKFEKDFGKKANSPLSNPQWNPTGQYLEYEFYRSFPISINSMPVSYEAANLLKCTVSMNYIRYTVRRSSSSNIASDSPPLTPPAASPVQKIQSVLNSDEYYNNFGDNNQNSTNFGDFLDGSGSNPFTETVA